jgi:imidazoleglycerol phosphate synthase glutamine amidotransferase subunit HisH
VHSYYVVPEDPGVVVATARYGDVEFCAALRRGNTFACQFHPERSGPAGLEVYRAFGALVAAHAARPERRAS